MGKKLPSAFLYTMNATREQAEQFHLYDSLAPYEIFAANLLGTAPHKFYTFNTLQFKDYSQYESSIFSETEKKAYAQKHWSEELQQAYELGKQLVSYK